MISAALSSNDTNASQEQTRVTELIRSIIQRAEQLWREHATPAPADAAGADADAAAAGMRASTSNLFRNNPYLQEAIRTLEEAILHIASKVCYRLTNHSSYLFCFNYVSTKHVLIHTKTPVLIHNSIKRCVRSVYSSLTYLFS